MVLGFAVGMWHLLQMTKAKAGGNRDQESNGDTARQVSRPNMLSCESASLALCSPSIATIHGALESPAIYRSWSFRRESLFMHGNGCAAASVGRRRVALTRYYLGNQLDARVQGVLAAMLFRMGLPLAVALIACRKSMARWHDAVGLTILGTYLVALLVETLLVV